MATCLFTGEILDSKTKVEHTILRTLGGRIRSRLVASSAFNQKSSKFDNAFSSQYKLILSELAPLLPNEAAPGPLRLVSEDGTRKYKKVDGITQFSEMIITDYDDSGKPRGVVYPEHFDKDKVMARLNWSSIGEPEYIPQPDEISFLRDCELNSEAHISALKCFLLTFDHIMQERNFFHFTRDSQLAPLRNFIKKIIYDNEDIDVFELDRFYFGLQPDRRPLINKILKDVRHLVHPYEHTLIVSTDTAHKSLLGVWSVLGIDILGFKLCENWSSDPFMAIISNPVFRNEAVSFCFSEYESLDTLCIKTPYKSFSVIRKGEQLVDKMGHYYAYSRIRAYQDAALFLEMNADDFIWEQFRYIASRAESNISVAELLRIRLFRLYNRVYAEDELKHRLDEELKFSDFSPITPEQLGCFSDTQKEEILREYRKILQKLNEPLREPGYIFTENLHIDPMKISVR